MPFQRVEDVVELIRSFQQRLRKYYESQSETQRDERLALLLEYIGRHKQSLDACLDKFGRDGEKALRETWIQYVPGQHVQRSIDDTELRPDMTPDEVIRAILDMDHALIEFYQGLATSLVPPRVRELFSDLVQMDESKGKNYSRSLFDLSV